MRHRKKLAKLSRAADQRKALMRTLATSLFMHDEITIPLARAKALRPYADKIVTLAKRGDLHAIRQAARLIYNAPTGEVIEDKQGDKTREIPETVLRRLFRNVGSRFQERKGGYIRVLQAPPRRGDAAPMAIVQLVD
ncbi:MAG: 50S ribosomal protein L17 [Vampirovibrionales bacterium]|nr:50S ribosomal protein L17 [Vampirovibrionales bacterium]